MGVFRRRSNGLSPQGVSELLVCRNQDTRAGYKDTRTFHFHRFYSQRREAPPLQTPRLPPPTRRQQHRGDRSAGRGLVWDWPVWRRLRDDASLPSLRFQESKGLLAAFRGALGGQDVLVPRGCLELVRRVDAAPGRRVDLLCPLRAGISASGAGTRRRCGRPALQGGVSGMGLVSCPWWPGGELPRVSPRRSGAAQGPRPRPRPPGQPGALWAVARPRPGRTAGRPRDRPQAGPG